MGGSVLGEGQWVWGVHEVQETDQCTEIWLESDSQQKIHTLVVTDYQQSERKPYIYIASYGLVSHIVAWFITSSVAHYCGSLFPVSGEWSRGRVQEFLIGKVQTLTERTKSVCCCCCWVFSRSKLFLNQTYPYLYSRFQVRCCWFLIWDLAIARLFFCWKPTSLATVEWREVLPLLLYWW